MASLTARNQRTTTRGLDAPARRTATVLLTCSLVLAAGWFGWRIATVGPHPLRVVVLLIELSGWTGGVLVARGLLAARRPRAALRAEPTYRYAFAVADRVGRTRADDLRHDLRTATDRLLRRGASSPADRAMVGVMIDGPRRVALIGSLVLCLLLGVAPMAVPPVWAIALALSSSALLALAHRTASAGRIRLGDRTRWSFATLGEVLAPNDHTDVAPRRWVGTVGAVVVLNLCIALRGMSDRWTHGLPAMADDERLVAMGWAMLVVIAGLYALRTIPTPQLGNAHVVARRLEERTARQSAIGAAVCLGLVGLVAGVLPVDAPDDVDGGVERLDDADRSEPTEVTDG